MKDFLWKRFWRNAPMLLTNDLRNYIPSIQNLTACMEIPEELIDLILGFTSRDTLLNCTIVKSSWTHVARARLLHKLSFRLSSKHIFSNFAALAECFSSDPHLAQRVSILELGQTKMHFETDPAFDEHLLVVPPFAQMTSVREVRFIDMDWTVIPQTISSAIWTLLSGRVFSRLHLEKLRISVNDLARLISSPQSLQTLCLVNLSTDQDSVNAMGVPAVRKGGATLQSLELGTSLNLNILDALVCMEKRPDYSTLRRLCLTATYPPALKELASVVGPSIEELFLSMKIITEPFDSFSLSLASMPRLLRLELTDGLTQGALESLFGTLESPHPLREIVVHEDEWALHSLSAAQAFYLQPALKELTRVEYRVKDHEVQAIRHVYEEEFAGLCERGVFFLVREKPEVVWPHWGLQRHATQWSCGL